MVDVAKLSIWQVYRALARLREVRLVAKVAGGYVAVVMDDSLLDERVAKPAGTLGKGEERRRKHRRERGERAAKRLYQARWGNGYKQLSPQRWRCPNCGQVWSLPDLEPPPFCDYCNDMTTWQLVD